MSKRTRILSVAALCCSPLTTAAQGQPAPTPSSPQLAAATPQTQPRSPAPVTPAANPGSSPQPTGQVALKIERHKLENGLRVVLNQDSTVPTVAVAVYYDVGSRNEERGHSGFAHLFEHMMFQGSQNVAKGQHFQLIMNRGGSMNGTTSDDRTNYFETLPSNELALGLWLEADRMRSLAITQENFENQRQTVMEERRQSYDNRPYAQSMLRINELAFGDYFPYAHSTIGDMQDLQAAPLSAVQEFFNTYYAPNNAVIGIAGDFEPQAALQLVQQYFGTIPQAKVKPFNTPDPAPQTAERKDSMLDPLAELPAFHVGYHIPKDRDPDHYPLELLASVLGDGESSRLYQKLVKEKEILQEIDVNTDGRRGPDLFSFWGIAAQGKSPEAARQLIDAELTAIAKNGITPRELDKAKNRKRAEFVFGLQTNLARATHLAEYEAFFGDAALLEGELPRYAAVTSDDVKRVAGQYFAATNRTILDVVPARGGAQPSGPGAKPPAPLARPPAPPPTAGPAAAGAPKAAPAAPPPAAPKAPAPPAPKAAPAGKEPGQ
ncbi:MAG: insulinase family protein [Polyangiales bacterium]